MAAPTININNSIVIIIIGNSIIISSSNIVISRLIALVTLNIINVSRTTLSPSALPSSNLRAAAPTHQTTKLCRRR
jgi:hypothetical protein